MKNEIGILYSVAMDMFNESTSYEQQKLNLLIGEMKLQGAAFVLLPYHSAESKMASELADKLGQKREDIISEFWSQRK